MKKPIKQSKTNQLRTLSERDLVVITGGTDAETIPVCAVVKGTKVTLYIGSCPP